MQKTEAAMILAGVQSEENREASAPTNLHVITGTVAETSENGKAKIRLDGLIFSADNEQSIPIDTLGGLEEGDTATILLFGESGHGMLPMAIGAGGSVDRVVERVKAIEADYVKATLLDAQVAQIGFLKADSATITNLQTQTAKIESLTAEQLSAATAYIAALTAGNITATSLTADVAKIHNLTAEQLSAAAGYISQLTADSVTAQNISAMYGDFATVKANAAKVANLTAQELEADHATIASLDSNYAQIGLANVNTAQITNGIIQTASIVDEQVFTVSGNKATLAEIDASKINVSNLNADNITVNKINGQTVTGKSISDALTQHETDISAKVDTTTFNSTVNGLNDRIDGAIETFTGTVVPTLSNSPASSWNTNAKKDQHIGDVYYVVNSNATENGYCYRFTKSGSTYSWQLIKDSDVTAALSRLQTAEGKITTFDSDISTLKTDTGELKTKTQSLETSLGDKVDVTTFNNLSSDVEENSATISSMSTVLTNNGLTSSTNISNTVNSVSQTANSNSSKISSLTTTLGTNADGTTKTGDIVHRTSSVEQGLSGITTRVGTLESTSTSYGTRITNAESTITQHTTDISLRATKTEAYQLSQPNLAPITQADLTSVYNATTNPNGYWRGAVSTWYTQLEDGWVRVYKDNSEGTEAANVTSFRPRACPSIVPGETYTILIEVRNNHTTGSGSTDMYIQQVTNNQFWGSGGGNIHPLTFGESTVIYSQKVADTEHLTDGTPSPELFRYNARCTAGSVLDFEFRLSLYEGEYTGPYKPYSGTQLYASQAELKVANDNISSKVSTTDYNGQTVASLINQSADSVVIEANHIELNGTTVFNTIRSTLDSTYDEKGAASAVQTNLNNLQIGGRNLFALSNAVQGYIRSSSPYGEIVLTPANPQHITSDFIPVSQGDIFTAQLWNPNLINNTTNSNRGVCWYDSSKAYLSMQTGTGDAAGARPTGVAHWSFTFNPAPANAAYARFGFIIGPSTNVIDPDIKIKVERGNKATDWTPSPEDVDASNRDWYAECTTAAATLAKVATITPETNSFSLVAGQTVKVKFTNTNSADRSTVTLNVNGTGDKQIRFLNNGSLGVLPAVGYLRGGTIITFTYDGTYWVADFSYNTNDVDRKRHNNAVKAAENITQYKICGGTSSGYKAIAESTTFDLAYPLLYMSSANLSGQTYALASGSTATTFYEALPSVTFTNTATIESGGANKMLYLKGTISGNTFTVAASNFLTTVVPSAATDPATFYIPLGVMTSATAGYFTSSKDLYAYIDGKFRQVNPTDIVASQKIYYRSKVSGTVPKPTSWVTESGNKYNDTVSVGNAGWSTKVTPIAADKNDGTTKYLYLYTCEQRKRLDGTIECTTVTLDENTTVIDGGSIITYSVTANQIAADAVTADKLAANSLTLGKFTADDKRLVDNSNVVVGGRNLLRKTGSLTTSDVNLARATVTEEGYLALTSTTSSAYASFKVHYLDFDDYGSGVYTISFDAKLSGATSDYTTSNVLAYLGFQDPSRVDSAVMNATYDRYTPARLLSSSLTSEWTRYETTVNVPDDLTSGNADALSSGYMMVVELAINAKKMPILIRRVKLEKGNKATDWTPAPEDQTTYVDTSLAESVESITTTIDTEVGTLADSISGVSNSLTTLGTKVDNLLTKATELEKKTQWVKWDDTEGMIFGENGTAFNTRLKAENMTFNYSNQTMMTLSATGGVDAPKVRTQRLELGSDWAITISGDMFAIDYIGS